MTTMTPEDAIKAAASVARDVADGKLSPADLGAQAVAECRELFGTVIGDGDPLWSLHADVARQAVSLGALSADELSEWAAVMRHRAGEAAEPPAPHDDLSPVESIVSVDESQPEPTDADGAPGADAATGDLSAALAVLTARSIEHRAKRGNDRAKRQGSADGYDPLAGWDAGGSQRR